MSNLTTTYVGLKLRSPIITGSAGITETVERMKKVQDNGAGAVIMKSLFEDKISRTSPTPRFKLIKYNKGLKNNKIKEGFSLYSYEQGSEWNLERYAEEVSRAKKELDIPIIVSINCISEKGWVSYAKRLEEVGADALEINLSCPHSSIIFRGKDVEKSILDTVRLVRENVSLPIIAKISPQLTSPVQIVKEIESIGVDGVTLFNRLTGIDVDIEEEKPTMHEGYAGYGGPWTIQHSLRWISEISPQVGIDISGSGGVYRAEDVIKYLLAGATTVQVVTAIFLNGYGIIKEITEGLKKYMDEKRYEGIEDFRGKLSSRIKGTYEIKRDHYLKAEIKDKLIPPCQAACPAGINIQGYIALISQGKFEEAFQLIKEKVPFPLVLSRICPHPCEERCVRGKIDEPIAINVLKKFVCDWQIKKSEVYPDSSLKYPKSDGQDLSGEIPPNNSQFPTDGSNSSISSLVFPSNNSQPKVAIIGAGPAGLTCAYDLAKLGYKVTVFESSSKAGGMLAMGIPEYRLPKKLVKREVREIEEQGVEIKLNITIGKDLTLDNLKEMDYKAIFIATGAHKSKRLNIPGEDLEGVIDGLSFLKRVNLGKKVKVGKRVAIIGGGNTAIDVARSSIRLGAKEVYLLYRRTRAEMPVIPEEVERAEEEGVKILYLTLPTEIIGEKGKVCSIKCIPLVLDGVDREGRRKSLSVSASEFFLKIDTLIVAIGQSADLSFLEEKLKLKIAKDNTIMVNPATYATSQPYIFAAGDVVKDSFSVIEAIAAGKKAAISIHRYLQGESLEEDHERDEVVVSAKKVLKEKGFVEQKDRVEISTLPIERRCSTFEEIEKVLKKKEAIQEARRCLACGCGLGCGICERVCIYSALKRIRGRYKIDTEKCDGCGLCVEVCPKENIRMVEV